MMVIKTPKPRVKKAKARKRVRHIAFGEDEDWLSVYEWLAGCPDNEEEGNK
jgi:hypothetical protein